MGNMDREKNASVRYQNLLALDTDLDKNWVTAGCQSHSERASAEEDGVIGEGTNQIEGWKGYSI